MGPVRALWATLVLTVCLDLASAIHVVNSTFTRASSLATTGSVSSYGNASLAATGSGSANTSLAPTGSGSAYASQCMALSSSYSSAYTSWSNNHATVATSTEYFGGMTISTYTAYQDEQPRLCDGHARLLYSPAIPISTTVINSTVPITSTSTELFTVFSMYPGPSPTCSYPPSDCDPYWQAYSTSLSSWRSASPQITPPPQTPGCYNSSYYSSMMAAQAFLTECGPCTIFGQGVELVYFPVPSTVSRDMCATTPSASLTNYGPNAVITAYAGASYANSTFGNATFPPGETIVTAVANGHTFTSGTAYISISSVWAEDRCMNTLGTPVTDAILAMPSESVLSLRYSQNHFQYFWLTNTQTGYPVSYADFNQPIPYSAWNGQAMCDQLAWWECQIIYENEYRPQLAIPPQITMLNPEWEGCQLWYGGLYDPPLALTATTLVVPTAPAGWIAPAATPSQTVAATTATRTYTAVADNAGLSTNAADASNASGGSGSNAGQAGSAGAAQSTSGSSGGLGALIYSGISGGSGSGEGSDSGVSSGSKGNSNAEANTGTSGGSSYNENSGPQEGSDNGGSSGDDGSSSSESTSGSSEGHASEGQSKSGGSSLTGSGSSESGSNVNFGGSNGAGSTGSGSESEGSSGSGTIVSSEQSNGSGSEFQGTSESGNGDGAEGTSGNRGSGSSESSGSASSGTQGSVPGSDEASAGAGSGPAAYSEVFAVNDQTYTAVVTKNIVSICSTTISSGAAAQTVPGGLVVSYGSHVLKIQGSSTLFLTDKATRAGVPPVSGQTPFKTTLNIAGETIVISEYPTPTEAVAVDQAGAPAVSGQTSFTTTLTIAGETIVVSQYPTPTDAIAVGSTNLVIGGPATTLANGEVISYASDGLVFTTPQATRSGARPVSGQTLLETTLNIVGYPTPTDAIAVGSTKLVVGGPATTLANGEVISYASEGLVFTWSTAVALEQDGEFSDATGSRNAVGSAATASAKLSGQAASGMSAQGAADGANALGSQTSATGTSGNTAASVSIQRITPTSKSGASSDAAPFGLVIFALAAYFTIG
ncbi:hypothetical protein MBLNU457_7567t1 [Dothideomycetes sp. NU457]